MKKVYFLFICTLLLGFISCDFGIEEIPRQRELVDISLDTTLAILDYALDTPKLNTIGLKIYGHYSDGTTDEINVADAKFTGFDSTSMGPVTIDVEFRGIHKQYDINVGEDLPERLEIVSYPKKLLYWNTDINNQSNIDYDGLKVELHYKSGKCEDVTEKLTKEKEGKIINFTQYIKLSFKGIDCDELYIYVFKREELSAYYSHNNLTLSQNITDYLSITNDKNNLKQNYSIGEKIEFPDAATISITDIVTGKLYVKRPLNKCYLNEKEVTEKMLKNNQTTVNINNITVPISINIIDKYIKGATFKTTEDFYKENYKGNSVRFIDDKYFSFQRVYDSISEPIIFENDKIKISSEHEEYLRYSSTDEGFDNALDISVPYKLDKVGENKVFFYYKYYSNKTNRNEVFPFEATIFVQDAKLEYLEVKYTNNKIKFDENNSNYLSEIRITLLKGIRTDGTSCTFDNNNNVSYKIVNKPNLKKEDFTNNEFKAQIQVLYKVSSDLTIKTKDTDPLNVTLVIDSPS